jgi:hypothetical protein
MTLRAAVTVFFLRALLGLQHPELNNDTTRRRLKRQAAVLLNALTPLPDRLSLWRFALDTKKQKRLIPRRKHIAPSLSLSPLCEPLAINRPAFCVTIYTRGLSCC